MDIYDINSIIEAFKYKKTATEIAKDLLESELEIPYEEFDKLDYDEQHKIIQSRNLQMSEKLLHERNYDRFQQIARDRISENRHKPTLSEITEKVEVKNKGRTNYSH